MCLDLDLERKQSLLFQKSLEGSYRLDLYASECHSVFTLAVHRSGL